MIICGCEKADRIIDVDCYFDSGKFFMRKMPGCLPRLFTIRFIAPDDYNTGDVIVVDDKELPICTPGMTSATSGLFKAGAVMLCNVDLDRKLAFIHAGFGSSYTDCMHRCYFEKLELWASDLGDDQNGTGSQANPLRSMTGVFAYLNEHYRGYIKNLHIYLNSGEYRAPRSWLDNTQAFSVENLYVQGKNTANNMSETVVSGSGFSISSPSVRVEVSGFSIHCTDEVEANIIAVNADNASVRIKGFVRIENLGSSPKNGIATYGHSFMYLGDAAGDNRIEMSGAFTNAIYSSNYAVTNIGIAAQMSFRGSSTNLIYINGVGSLYVIANSSPQFLDGFKGNIRAGNGSTIALPTNAAAWLPTGSTWVKDDTSRITGQ